MIENIRLSLVGIKTHKLRSFLTMLGVIIGIASIIAIVSIVEGTNTKLEKSLIGAGNNVTTVALSQEGTPYDMSYNAIPSGIYPVSDEAVSEIAAIDGIDAAARFLARDIYGSDIYRRDQALSYGRLYGISGGYLDTLQYTIQKGRDFTDKEYGSAAKVAIIDLAAAEALFDSDDPIGDVIEIKGEPFVVVGICADTNKTETEYTDINDYYMYGAASSMGMVYIPENAWPLVYQFDEPETVAIRVRNTADMTPLGNKAAAVLNRYISNDTIQYASQSTIEDVGSIKELTSAISLLLVSIASLSLLVGGIGVMNIMLVSVTERTSEIGLKKALGAKPRNILLQFLTESAMLTLVGGVIGIILGIIAAKVISYVAGLEFGVSVLWILISLTFSVFIGLLFGAMPARRASKLNPIDALRHE